MGAAIGEILGNAVGVAVSPVPIMAVVLMLFTPKAVGNSLSFLLGWIVGLSVVGVVVLWLELARTGGGEADSGGWLKIVIGALFVFLAWKQWSGRAPEGQEPELPGWMASLDEFSPGKSLGFGFVMSAVKPKNLGLTVVAMISITGAGLSSGEEVGTLAVFVLISSVTVAVPVLLNLALGEKPNRRSSS